MKYFLWLVATVTACASALAQPPAGDGSKIEICMPGSFNPNETDIADGDVWWVLFQAAGEQVRLRYAPVSVRPNAFAGAIASVDGFSNSEVILLFRGTKELPRGPVSTVFNGWIGLVPGQELSIGSGSFDNLHIEVHPFIRTLVSGIPLNSPAKGDYEIRLIQKEAIKQVLLKVPWQREDTRNLSFVEAHPGLLWAGDLDKDHKLDLLLSLTTHYAGPHYALYLSTYAQGDDLVHLVAEYLGPGC